MNYSAAISPNYVGIFELDIQGMILYSRQTQTNTNTLPSNYLVGQNFFEEIACFDNASDFHRRFKNFINSHNSKENFSFECRLIEGNVPIRVLMLRAKEKTESQTNDIVILDIRKNEI